VPLIIGLYYYKNLEMESRIILFLVILASLPQLLTDFMTNARLLNFIYNIYTPIEFLLTYFLIGNKMRGRIFRNISILVVIVFIALSVAICVRVGLNHRFLNEWVCAANTCYFCWVLLFILESLLNEKKLLNVNLPLFWYISGLLFYTPCTMFVFALSYYITRSQNHFINKLWIIHGIFNTALYLLFAAGLYVAGVQQYGRRLRQETSQ
jgi:hypothetical protein